MKRRMAVAMLSVALLVPGALAEGPAEDNARGVQYYEAGRWDEALRFFERAYEQVPGSETIRRNLCNTHQAKANELAKVADFAAAARHLETAISIDPENASPLIQLGLYYLRLDMVADAIFRLEEAIELDEYSLDAHELLGDAYYKDNDLASARAHWEWVYEMEPQRPRLAEKIAKATREQSVEHYFRQHESRHFRLSFPPGTPASVLSDVLQILERAYMDIGRNFSRTFPPTPIQVIVHNNTSFADVTQMGEHVGGLYDGKIRIPAIGPEGVPLPPEELTRRLYHEYVHVVVRFLAGTNVPWWLNEGLAECFSRPFDRQEAAMLEAAEQQGQLFSLRDLEGSQLERLDPQALRLAYCQSHATVQMLWTRYGQRRLRSLMSSLAEGMGAEEALTENYRRDYAALEDEVLDSYKQLTGL